MPRTPFTQISNVTSLNRATAPTSAIVIVLARALSSAGFALSLLAIWVGWLLPLQSIQTKSIPRQRRTLHLSNLPKHPHNRGASAPITLTPIFEPRGEGGHVTPKRVYFADRQSVAEQRRNTLPAESFTLDVVEKPPPDAALNPPTVVPPPSTLTPPATPPVAKLSFDGIDSSVVDSDSSRHSSMTSICPSSRLPKLKLGFTGRAKQHLGNKHVDTVNLEREGSVKSAKRGSGGFSAPWSASRTRTPTEITIDSEPQTSSTSRLSLARCFTPTRSNTCPPATATFTCRSRSRKAQRRPSTPIPRTSPYAAPYFASPPIILDDGYSGYPRGRPQLEDEVSLTPEQPPVMGEFGEKESNGWDQNHTTTPTHGRFPRTHRVVSKRRSASDSWATRSPVPPSF